MPVVIHLRFLCYFGLSCTTPDLEDDHSDDLLKCLVVAGVWNNDHNDRVFVRSKKLQYETVCSTFFGLCQLRVRVQPSTGYLLRDCRATRRLHYVRIPNNNY
jgi:hypothetical protein